MLAINAGSSSLKMRLVTDGDRIEATADLGAAGDAHVVEDVTRFLESVPDADVAAHRIVHGGDRFRASTVVDQDVRRELGRLTDLAPLQNPAALAGMDLISRLRPNLPMVACFDTAFHASLSEVASSYAVPAQWREWGVKRYGFHGLSYAYGSRRAAALFGRPVEELRLIVCHLGSGSSVAAISAGRSVDTTMGFTPLEGLVMATRSGDVDPGAVLWVQQHHGLSAVETQRQLEQESGLLGLSGETGDMKELLERRSQNDGPAAFAVAVYIHRLQAKIAAMAAALGGADALVFTGGVGERAAAIRAELGSRLGWLGVAVDDVANAGVGHEDADISSPAAIVRTFVVHAREELELARECRRLLGA